MRRIRSYLVIAVSVAVAHGAAPRLAKADEPASAPAPSVEEGRRLFRAAVEREDAGDHAGALALYRQARAHAVSPQLLFNIGSIEDKLDRLLDAAKTFREAEREAQALGNDEVLRETRARLGDLARSTPRFLVRIPQGIEGVEVLLDGAPSATSGEPVLVDPGEHRVVAHGPDGAAFEIVAVVRRGEVRTVDVVFPTSTAGATLATSAPPVPESRVLARPNVVPAVIAGSATLVLGTLAGVTFAAGRAKKERYVALNDAPTRENEADRIALSDDGRSLYVASTVFGITAAVAGVATVYFVVRSLAKPPARPATRTWLVPSARGMTVGGAF